MKYDCVIIGAGMSGLAAGIRLAMFDRKVCILEMHYTAGGLNSYYSMGGRLFDVGLHAVTNYARKGVPGPLMKVCRQLRIPYDDWGLEEQQFSEIRFPGRTLRFTNDFSVLRAGIAEAFPGEIDGFDRLTKAVAAYDDLDLYAPPPGPARPRLREFLRDPLLIEMLLCPLQFYGSATEHDMDFDQFVTLFKSIYEQGFSRPADGVRRVIKRLTARYREAGGELRMQAKVAGLTARDGRITSIQLENGETLEADLILSSIGALETFRLCSDQPRSDASRAADLSTLSFMESISCLDREPKALGHDATIVFFSLTETFHYATPDKPVDVRSGVIASPNNYRNHDGKEGMIRLTNIADPRFWLAAAEDGYRRAKQEWYNASVAETVRVMPDFRPHVTYADCFTPRTIRHFTGHENGAVYGSPRKRKDGRTPYANLALCGTDQGYLGIMGAMLSGITIANVHGLQGGRGES